MALYILITVTLAENMELDLKTAGRMEGGGCPLETLLNALIIALEIPVLGNSDYLDLALPRLCKAAALLPIHAQVYLLLKYTKVELLISLIYRYCSEHYKVG